MGRCLTLPVIGSFDETTTVQAPQPPSPQTYFVPLRLTESVRRYAANDCVGLKVPSSSVTGFPLRTNSIDLRTAAFLVKERETAASIRNFK